MKYFLAFLVIFITSKAIFAVKSRRYLQNGNATIIQNVQTLERLNDRLTQLLALQEEQQKRLESIDNKLTTMDITDKERSEAARVEVREMTRRTQNWDYQSSRTEGNLDLMKNELEAIRQTLDNNGLRMVYKQAQEQTTVDDGDISLKLTALAEFITTIRLAIRDLEAKSNGTDEELKHLIDGVRDIRRHLNSIPTKQHLNNAVHNIKSQPVYTITTQHSTGVGNLETDSLTPNSCLSATSSGLLKIQINSMKESFYVMCDAITEQGGWTVVQSRINGLINFNRNWLEYKFGFGNIASEFFIGLDKLHDITASQLHELLIVMEDFKGENRTAKYKHFAIGGEKEDYALNILGEYEGTSGDSLGYSAGYKFSTFDSDNDGWLEGNCAQAHTGAWWYNACEMSNLNGQYLGGDVPEDRRYQGIYWNEFHGSKYSLKTVKMMIRPIDRTAYQN